MRIGGGVREVSEASEGGREGRSEGGEGGRVWSFIEVSAGEWRVTVRQEKS